MTLNEYMQATGFAVIKRGTDTDLTGCYCGDLLSWVMGRAQEGQVWLTVMSNVNVAAVAALTGVAAVVLCEGAEPDDDLVKKASEHGIALLSTGRTVYEAACLTASLLK